ncbi:MAG TPA: LPS export ABC transporter permease LptF [Spongiibacteraceae bacterium]|nr:LPS export ABC transporter permease LptF [Spongiibacteraceae bacterium]
MILFRYITREIFMTMLAVTFTLLVIVISSRLVAYLGSAAAGDLPAGLVFSIIFFRLPGFLELIMPLGFFVSVLLVLGRMYVDSEMTVITACGIGPQRVLVMALVPALLVAVIVGATSMFVTPFTTLRVQQMLNDAGNATGVDLVAAGSFRVINQGRGRVTYVDRVDPDTGDMLDVFAADRYTGSNGASQQVILVAARGHTQLDPETGEKFLVLREGTRYLGQPGAREFQVMDFAMLGQLMEQAASTPIYRKQDTLTTPELLRSQRPESKATLQWRISLALLVLVSTLTGVALARTNHRRGRYGKLFPAFLLFMVYFVMLSAARDAVAKQRLSIDLGLWWVHGIFVVIGLLLVFWPDQWQRWRIRRMQARPVQ